MHLFGSFILVFILPIGCGFLWQHVNTYITLAIWYIIYNFLVVYPFYTIHESFLTEQTSKTRWCWILPVPCISICIEAFTPFFPYKRLVFHSLFLFGALLIWPYLSYRWLSNHQYFLHLFNDTSTSTIHM